MPHWAEKMKRMPRLRVEMYRSGLIGRIEGGTARWHDNRHPKTGVGVREREAKVRKWKEAASATTTELASPSIRTLTPLSCKVSPHLLATGGGQENDREERSAVIIITDSKQNR